MHDLAKKIQTSQTAFLIVVATPLLLLLVFVALYLNSRNELDELKSSQTQIQQDNQQLEALTDELKRQNRELIDELGEDNEL